LSMSGQSADGGPIAACVFGETDPEDRKKIFSNFHDSGNNLTILVTCATLIEGFSESLVEWVIVAKPVKSKSQIVQIVGRGLRLGGNDDKRANNSKKSCFRAIFLYPVDENIIKDFYPDPGVEISKRSEPEFKITFVSPDAANIVHTKSHEASGLISGYTRYRPKISAQRNEQEENASLQTSSSSRHGMFAMNGVEGQPSSKRRKITRRNSESHDGASSKSGKAGNSGESVSGKSHAYSIESGNKRKLPGIVGHGIIDPKRYKIDNQMGRSL